MRCETYINREIKDQERLGQRACIKIIIDRKFIDDIIKENRNLNEEFLLKVLRFF